MWVTKIPPESIQTILERIDPHAREKRMDATAPLNECWESSGNSINFEDSVTSVLGFLADKTASWMNVYRTALLSSGVHRKL